MRRRVGSVAEATEGLKECGADTGIWKKVGSTAAGGEEVSEPGSERKSGTSRSESSDSPIVERTLAVTVHGTGQLVPHVPTEEKELETALVRIAMHAKVVTKHCSHDQHCLRHKLLANLKTKWVSVTVPLQLLQDPCQVTHLLSPSEKQEVISKKGKEVPSVKSVTTAAVRLPASLAE